MRIHVCFQCAGALYKTRELHAAGGDAPLPVEQVLRQAGLLDLRPGLAMYRTDAEALLALQQLPEAVARA